MLVSPTLPVGGYSFSHGLEAAVQQGWVPQEAAARDWILGIAHRVLPKLDMPILIRFMHSFAQADAAGLAYWNHYLLASRETAELLNEEQQMGQALARLLPTFDLAEVAQQLPSRPSFAAAFAAACHAWAIPTQAAAMAYAWVWFENQVAAAVKLVPLGHSQGQRLLLECSKHLEPMAAQALGCADEDLTAGTVGLAVASTRHERQPARLFRS